MQFTVTGLGPIKEASIDMGRKLTVFCGPNNTGKTYLSYIVYALVRLRNVVPNAGILSFNPDKLLEQDHVEVPADKDRLWQYYQICIKTLASNLSTIFGTSHEKAKDFFPDFSIHLETDIDSFEKRIIDEEFSYVKNNLCITKKAGDHFVLVKMDQNTGDIEKKYSISEQIAAYLTFYPISAAYILPVERNSINTFSKELSIKRNALIDKMYDLSSKEIDPTDYLLKRTTRYPLPIRDGLEVAEDLGNLQNWKSDYFSFAEEIENELLHGKIKISTDGEMQFVSDNAKTKQLPIHLTASIIKTLSSLVFYLKHQAKQNDLVIIDEPELNLHPDNQIILARIFARMINHGLRLLISTHSDYMIREINNLIMLSSNKEEIRKLSTELGYKKDEYILPGDINAYLFNYKTKTKVEVKQIPLTVGGFDVETIDRTINDLNARSEELYYTLTYGNE